jgi:glycosyltransferase involved in cell wall biosynthesis
VESSPQKPEKSFLIVTAGRLHPQKGHRILLQAVDELVHQRHRSLKLIIFGKGESEASLRHYVQTHSLEQNVLIAGFVAEPRYWYRIADLFVLPSLWEGMPNALIEAAACGLPVLSTDCPSGPSEILDGGRCGRLVPTGDARAIADAI